MKFSAVNRFRARRPLVRVGVIAVGFAGLGLSACSVSSASHPKVTPATKPNPTTTTTPLAATCPLSGLPAPAGGVPDRPAMAVKIDNYPAARPQSGLDKADVVFEEPVEGNITRYAAVFQCNDASLIGPVRSARNVDVGILGQLGNPLLAHVGGVDPVINNIDNSPIVNVELNNIDALMIHPAGTVPPDSDYTSTSLIYGTHPKMTTAPNPLFTYSNTTPTGSAASTVNIDYSNMSNVTWKYNPSLHVFQRFYNGTTPDLLQDGTQNAAANVVVQYVQVTYGPWVEDTNGSLEVQADLYPNASGTAVVYRDGVAVPATWHRSTLGSPTQYVDSSGHPIAMQPGQTWVEIVPSTILATATP